MNRLKVLYLSHLSKPAADRPVYRAIRREGVRRIVELGVGSGQRARRMIEIAAANLPVGEVRYTGVDMFEGRSSVDGPGVTLKMAHRMLTSTGAKIRLLPGDPFSALARSANGLVGTELVVISAKVEPTSLRRAWTYFPRMLAEDSVVLLEERAGSGGLTRFRRLTEIEILALARDTTLKRAA